MDEDLAELLKILLVVGIVAAIIIGFRLAGVTVLEDFVNSVL